MIDFTLAILCSILYFILKFMESKIMKNPISLKKTFRDTLFVGFSIIVGTFILNQINFLSSTVSTPHVFISEPDF